MVLYLSHLQRVFDEYWIEYSEDKSKFKTQKLSEESTSEEDAGTSAEGNEELTKGIADAHRSETPEEEFSKVEMKTLMKKHIESLKMDDAAKLGACVHAVAGDVVAKEGGRGMIATDLLVVIRKIMGN